MKKIVILSLLIAAFCAPALHARQSLGFKKGYTSSVELRAMAVADSDRKGHFLFVETVHGYAFGDSLFWEEARDLAILLRLLIFFSRSMPRGNIIFQIDLYLLLLALSLVWE